MITERSNMVGRVNAQREQSAVKGDGYQRESAEAMQKQFGGRDIGSVLNQIADPNWVDPTKTRKVGNNELDKDAFLKLMLTQMKSQDPTNPLQSHEMAAQLAQFTSLEQMQNMNTNIEKLVDNSAPNDNYQALSMIGKVVKSDSSFVSHAPGISDHQIRFELDKDAQQVEVVIRDSSGSEVRTYQFHNLKAGENSINWNARTNEGYEARPGDFRVSINARDEGGRVVPAKTEISGKITGINFSNNGPILLVGNQSLRMSDIKQIQDESLLKEATKNDITGLDLSEGSNVDLKEGEQPVGNLNQVAMQRDLKNKIDKAK